MFACFAVFFVFSVYQLWRSQEGILYHPTIPGAGFGRRCDENPPPLDSPIDDFWTSRSSGGGGGDNGGESGGGGGGGMPFEEAYIESIDGVLIHAWLVWAPADVDSRSAPTVVYCHANAGNMGLRLPLVSALVESTRGNVLLWDYRGYGASGGQPGEVGIRADAAAVSRWLEARRDIDKRKIFWYGQSLGGSVAAHAVADALLKEEEEGTVAPPQPPAAAGLILENTFTSISDMVDALMPMIALFKSSVLRLKWDTAAIAGSLGVRVPALFISGLADALVPPRLMASLHDQFTKAWGIARARGDPRAPIREPILLKIEGAGHNDVTNVMGARWGLEIAQFITQTLTDTLGHEEAAPKLLSLEEAAAIKSARNLYLAPKRAARLVWLASGAARARLPTAPGGVGVAVAPTPPVLPVVIKKSGGEEERRPVSLLSASGSDKSVNDASSLIEQVETGVNGETSTSSVTGDGGGDLRRRRV